MKALSTLAFALLASASTLSADCGPQGCQVRPLCHKRPQFNCRPVPKPCYQPTFRVNTCAGSSEYNAYWDQQDRVIGANPNSSTAGYANPRAVSNSDRTNSDVNSDRANSADRMVNSSSDTAPTTAPAQPVAPAQADRLIK